MYFCSSVYTASFHLFSVRTLLTYQLGNPDIPLILVGDLNGYLEPVLDKLPPPIVSVKHHCTTLLKYVEEMGWIDPCQF